MANWQKLADAGLVRKVYHYGHPANDPEDEATEFLNYVGTAGAIKSTDLLVLDLETGDGKSQSQVNAWAKAWATWLRHLIPRHGPVLYTSRFYQENQTGVGLNGPFGAWWYKYYPFAYVDKLIWPETFNPTLPSPNAWGGPPDFWQFSQSFPSVEGVLDANVYNGTLAQLRALNQ